MSPLLKLYISMETVNISANWTLF